MPVILATDGASANAGYVNSNVTAALRSFAVDYWPTHTADADLVPGAYAMTPAWPPAAPKVVGAVAAVSYFDDFYNRIHIAPSRIDLGNLISVQTRSVVVWNAWPDQSRSLTALDLVAAGGITATGEGALPLAFAPLQQRTWSIAVGTDGPAVIAATLSWLFAGLDPIPVEITGNRLTAWTIPPVWHNGVLERLEWLTEVQRGADGSEDAYPLRDTPRRTWEFDVRVAAANRWLLEATLYDWSARNWAFPVSPDASVLAALLPAASSSIPLATANLDYSIGGLAMLWSSPTSYELVEIADIQVNALLLVRPTVSEWPRGSRVYPTRIAQLADRPQLQRPTSRRADAHVRMEAIEPCDWPAVPPATMYAGYPVLEHADEVSAVPTVVYERDLDVLDDDIGPISVDDLTGLAWPQQSHAWKLNGRAARASHRSLLYYFAGRANLAWLSSGQDDIELVALVGATAATMDIAWCGYTRFGRGQAGRKHLRIELVDGTVFHRAITTWAEVDAATERLGINGQLARDVSPEQVARISFLSLRRLAGDAVEIQHLTDSEGAAACSVQFAGAPGNE
ncbi:MAG: hypothetical protein ACYCZI_04120 [Metallibacterium scheffleri]